NVVEVLAALTEKLTNHVGQVVGHHLTVRPRRAGIKARRHSSNRVAGRNTRETITRPGARFAMPRILTIDDSSTIRSIITKQMSELGFEVDHAEDGQQGLAKLEEVTVDLILLDVTMPVMDGPTMLAALRERGDRTPVIMLTSESKRSIVAGAIKL